MKLRTIVANLALAVISVFIVSLALDRLLVLFDFPSEVPPQVTHSPGISGSVKNIEFEYTFATNSQGLRSPEIPLARGDGEFRILMAGDSFVQGIGVDVDETIPAYLEEALSTDAQTIRVLNGGLAGTGLVAYGKLIFHLLDVYEIDAVLIALFANDVHSMSVNANPKAVYPQIPQRWGIDRLVHALWPRIYTLVAQALEGPGKPSAVRIRAEKQADIVDRLGERAAVHGIDEAEIDAWKKRARIWLDTLTPEQREEAQRGEFNWEGMTYGMSRPDYWAAGIDIDTPLAERRWTAMAAVLEEIVRGVRARGKGIAIIYIPSRFQYERASHEPHHVGKLSGVEILSSWLTGELEIDRRLAALVQGTRIPLLNLTPALRAESAAGTALNWQHDVHLNSAGNRFVAETVARWLREERVFEGIR